LRRTPAAVELGGLVQLARYALEGGQIDQGWRRPCSSQVAATTTESMAVLVDWSHCCSGRWRKFRMPLNRP